MEAMHLCTILGRSDCDSPYDPSYDSSDPPHRPHRMEAMHSGTMSRSKQQADSKAGLVRSGLGTLDTGNQLSRGVGVELPKGPTRYEQLEYWKAQLKPSEFS